MEQALDITGIKYGRLTALKVGPRTRRGRATWLCQCECGSMPKAIDRHQLISGRTISCGCAQREAARQNGKKGITHGHSNSPEYNVWYSMVGRCEDPKNRSYADYGGRGIKVCDSWKSDIRNFIDSMGIPIPGMTIERKNNNGDYCPENCIWIPRSEQSRNRRNNVWITYNGETKLKGDWCKELGLNNANWDQKIRNGWTVEEILGTPKGVRLSRVRKE